jgi:hypothetical protein
LTTTGARASAAPVVTGLFVLCACAPPGTGGLSTEAAVSRSLRAQSAVFVSGWIGVTDLGLDPVLATDAAPTRLAPAEGPYRLRGTSDEGDTEFDVAFDERAMASISGGETRHFAFVVPVAGGSLAIARIELEASDGRRLVHDARLSSSAMGEAAAAERQLTLERAAGGALRVRWDAGRFPLVQIRDPGTGTVLAAGRDGELLLADGPVELDVMLSDGVRSAVTRAHIP